MDDFILCVRNKLPKVDSFGIDMGSALYLKVPANAAVPLPSHGSAGVKSRLAAVIAQANPPGTVRGKELDIVFMVHGYNTDAREALVRQRHVQSELRKRGYDCMVIGFDWPTAGTAISYLYDRAEAHQAASSLVTNGIVPFADFTLKDCPINIHVMAHSMGAFVVREAFRTVDKGRNADLANDWRIGQLVLFAADLSSDCFAKGDADTKSMFSHCGRLTNYFGGHDEALAVSNIKNIDISSRVGRVGMPSAETQTDDKAVDVNCTPHYEMLPHGDFKVIKGMESHSWYFEDSLWYDDLAYTLAGQLDRNAIPTRTKLATNDFVLKP